jgi:hypothetical protein
MRIKQAMTTIDMIREIRAIGIEVKPEQETKLKICLMTCFYALNKTNEKDLLRELFDKVIDLDSKIDKMILEKKSSKRKPKDNNFIEVLCSIFSIEYQKTRNIFYQVTGADKKAMARLVQMYRKKFPNSKSEHAIESFSAYFAQCMNITDPFIRDGMGISFVANQINKINNLLVNGKTRKNNQSEVSNSDIANIIARKFTEKRIESEQ